MVDYHIIADALDFYQEQGFTRVEVPWIVSREAITPTTPDGKRQFSTFLGDLVASAEQSFIQMMMDGTLSEGKYVACSPCFRDEEVIDDLHKQYFMKVELISINGKLKDTLEPAKKFYSRYLDVCEDYIDHPQIDLVPKNSYDELGSYGCRKIHTDEHKIAWAYGTGVAEPRLSTILEKNGFGYHVMPIPKSAFPSVEKICEESMELLDAKRQNNPIMELTELSDILGAVKGYLNKRFPNISYDDLNSMADTTLRAFESGRRT